MQDNPWEVLRRIPKPDLAALAPDTVSWVLSLPDCIRPHAVAKKWPAVLNELAALRNRPSELARRVSELASTTRLNGQAFSYDVLADLRVLAEALEDGEMRPEGRNPPGVC